MNIKDSYLHSGTHLVKNINFTTSSGVLKAVITWALEGTEDSEITIPTIGGASFGSQTANYVLAAPNGSAGNPTFRALVAADIPNLDANKIVSGTIAASLLPMASTSARGAVLIGEAQTSDNDSAITDKKYWVKMNANGKLFVDIPWDNTHYTAIPILGATNATTNATADTANNATFLNIIENNAKSGGIQITGAVGASVKANGGILTITSKWQAANSTQEGYAPQLQSGGTNLADSTNDYVLAFTYSDSGNLTPTWKKLPEKAYTWRDIQDNLTSLNNTTDSLSAHLGYLLANGSARDDTKLPLSGGTMTGAIKRYYSDASNDPMIALTSNSRDVWLWRINHGTNARVNTIQASGFGLKYIGTGDGVNNNLVLYADNLLNGGQFGDLVAAMTMDLSGKISLAVTPNVDGTDVSLEGHTHAYNTLTGSGTTADQAIVSTGTENEWLLKTLGSNAFNSISYLPLTGGVMLGAIKRYYSTASDNPMIALTSNNQDIWLWRVNHGTSSSVDTSAKSGFGLKYIGTGSGNDNSLVLYSDNLNISLIAAITINQDGTVTLSTTPKVGSTLVSLVGHTHAYTELTGSTTTADLAIVSSGTANGWTLKTLGSRAFDSTDYVKLDAGAAEQTIKSSIGNLGNGVVTFWRAISSGLPFIGFASGTTKTMWGMLGFTAANTLVFKNTSGTNYSIAHANNITDKAATITSSSTTLATIAGVNITAKLPTNAKDTAGIVAGPGAAGKVYISNSSGAPIWDTYDTTVTSDSAHLVTSGAVYTAIASSVSSAVQYMGTVGSEAEMIALTNAGRGDFARVLTEFTFTDATGNSVTAHVGDVVYLTNNTPETAANWIVAHTEIDQNTWVAWLGATSETNGVAGYMPAAVIDDRLKFLRGDGQWKSLSESSHTHSIIINGDTKTINASDGTAVNLGNFVPKIAGTGSVVAHQLSVQDWKGCKILIPGGYHAWMMAFTVRIYIGYQYTDIVFSGYHYGNRHWSSPAARGIGGTRSYKVVMGYEGDSANSLYVWFGNTDNTAFGYGGITIMNLHAGHNNGSDWYTAWSISDVAYADLTNKQLDTTTVLPAMIGHTHSLSIATNSGTNALTLTASTKYKLTAGGSEFIFTTPSDTWRGIYVNGTSTVGNDSSTKAINLVSNSLNIGYIGSGEEEGLSGSNNYFNLNINAKNWTGATDSIAGTSGYMPGASVDDKLKFLRGDGSWCELSDSSHTHTVSINGTTKTIAASDGTAVDLGSYVKLDAGATEQTIKNSYSDTLNKGSIEIWRAINSGYAMIGFANGTTETKLGKLGFARVDAPLFRDTTNHDYLLAHGGNITNSAATIGTDLTTLATIAGVNITAKLPIAARGESTVTSGVITPTDSGDTKFLREDGTWQVPNYTTDLYVKLSEDTGASYRGVMLGYNNNATANAGVATEVTNLAYITNNIVVLPSTGNLISLGKGRFSSVEVTSGSLKFTDNNNGSTIAWADGTYQLRILVTDDYTANTAVFTFQQSTNSGSSWGTLMTIRDNSRVVATEFIGALTGNATTASNLSKSGVRGFLYLSGDAATSATGYGTRDTTIIGIPYIHHTASDNDTYVLSEDLFYKSGDTIYLGNTIHSNKFACVKTKNSTTDDWDGSTTSGETTSSTTTYSAGTGININNGVISTTRKEWFGTEALFNNIASLDSETTYYIIAD